jgi:hypothetical protein
MKRIGLAVFTEVTVGVDFTKVDGSPHNTGLRFELEAVEAEADVHVLVAGAADGESALGSNVLRQPLDIPHHVAHVHQHLILEIIFAA